VGAAIVDDPHNPHHLLSARRTEPPHLAGGWELPGGKVEPDEDPVAAIHREIAEELGVQIALADELVNPDSGDGTWPMSDKYRMRVWLATVVAGVPAPIEDHDAVAWLPPHEWFDVPWLAADVPIVRAVLARRSRAAAEHPAAEHPRKRR
jgi:8-oxo-dGTP diphosphatase